ncbi:tubulin-specific chaperone E-like [Bolinopsis microptera]|uniref:tubulin-specific chaperone E-like n=1 Tax=Bolinopsis microptera TaxID=2820187 RepID=UPI003079CA57
MLNNLNTVVGLEVLWYPDAQRTWREDNFIGQNSVPGVVRYVGKVAGREGVWAGVQLDKPEGNHSGLYRGTQYFTCSKKCGIFTETHRLVKVCHPRRSKDVYRNGGKSSVDDNLFVKDIRAQPPVPSVDPMFVKKCKNGLTGYPDWTVKNHHRPQILAREKRLS